ncbi:hypothetical protein [Streptomyces sp. MK37H]|uniref:hypothetical protein n=1 Tax=Streptomyces sp. MK37H TaxID=2699117 RepID=UPI001B398589|nr:hypothetical protein [Streptomyces sp. MK37H]MBP8532828.1 hypothetical protein [Streptomyces sp. MK37H]
MEHLVLGLDTDLEEAMRQAVRDALTLLTDGYSIPGHIGLAQPVNRTWVVEAVDAKRARRPTDRSGTGTKTRARHGGRRRARVSAYRHGGLTSAKETWDGSGSD